ncbi:hypothetical protein GCM10009578_100040 [Streptomyces rhizosphaericus]
MEDLVGPVAVHRGLAERQAAHVRDPDVGAGPPLAGHGDHPLVGVHTRHPRPAPGQFGHGPPGAAAHVDHAGARLDRQELVGPGAQPLGLGRPLDAVQPRDEGIGGPFPVRPARCASPWT